MARMKIAVFLDFDGLLHPQVSFPEKDFFRLPRVASVLREFKDVISVDRPQNLNSMSAP